MLRPIDIMPKVTMKAATRPLVMMKPFTKPARPPARMAATMARGSGREASARPKMIPVAPESEPTDRSMPPIRITKVWPIATIPVITD